jgi:hypothetical protein
MEPLLLHRRQKQGNIVLLAGIVTTQRSHTVYRNCEMYYFRTLKHLYGAVDSTSSCGPSFLISRVKEFINEVGATSRQIVDSGTNDDQQKDVQKNTGVKPGIFHIP